MTARPEVDGYKGSATLRIGAATFEVEAELRGRFEPVDGRYHWYGRLSRNDALAAALTRGRAEGTLCTTDGSAECDVSDPDPWLRYRVTGISRPPFAVGHGRSRSTSSG